MKRDRWKRGWWVRCKNSTSSGLRCRLNNTPGHLEHRWWNSKGDKARWWGT